MSRLPHLNASGEAHMVDISEKAKTRREAVAEGRILMSEVALTAIRDATLAKGDALATARIAGIMAAKRTADLVPLCHPLPLDAVSLDLSIGDGQITASARVVTSHGTGVEMEAMTAVTVALLTLYDMAKALDRAMIIEAVRLRSKSGGRSGDFKAP